MNLLKSFGLKRGIGYVLVFAGQFVAPNIPALAPFAPALTEVGTLLLGVGFAHSIATKAAV